MLRIQQWLNAKAARVALVIVSLVAAVSQGGVFAGVVLAPLLVLAGRRSSRGAAWVYGALAGIVTGEVVWGLTYVLMGEREPVIWLVPTLAGLLALAATVTERAPRQPVDRPA